MFNKFIAKQKMAAVASKLDAINPQRVTNSLINGCGNLVTMCSYMAEIYKAIARFYAEMKENGKLRSAIITIIKEGKPILRDVVLRVKDNDALLDAIRTVSKEMDFEGSKLKVQVEKLEDDLMEDVNNSTENNKDKDQ